MFVVLSNHLISAKILQRSDLKRLDYDTHKMLSLTVFVNKWVERETLKSLEKSTENFSNDLRDS